MPRRDKKTGAERKRRILLVCGQSLLSDGLQAILGKLKDVELAGCSTLDDSMASQIHDFRPDIMLIAEEEDESVNAASFIARILGCYPDIPVIRVRLNQDTIRLHTSETLPARSVDLIEAIRRLPAVANPETGPASGAARGEYARGDKQ